MKITALPCLTPPCPCLTGPQRPVLPVNLRSGSARSEFIYKIGENWGPVKTEKHSPNP